MKRRTVKPIIRNSRSSRVGTHQEFPFFSTIHLHTGPQAAALAQSLDAHAFTHKNHIFFNQGKYNPGTSEGKRLLAHELTHVKQQATSPDAPSIQRWKMAGNTATAQQGDTLGALAFRVGARFNDWKCIKPLTMKTSKYAKKPAKFNDRYELYVQPGDTFDVTNLTAKTGPSLEIYLFDDGGHPMDANLAKWMYPGSTSSTNGADTDIEGAASFGSTPVQDFVIFGHAGGNAMWGGASSFRPSDFSPEQDAPSFGQAEAGMFPRRCWFSRTASARMVGCNSDTVGNDFAGHYLRKGASVITTTASVRPKCQGAALNAATGTCNSYNGVEFSSSASATAAITLDGPFWSTADFHGGKYWKTIKGKL